MAASTGPTCEVRKQQQFQNTARNDYCSCPMSTRVPSFPHCPSLHPLVLCRRSIRTSPLDRRRIFLTSFLEPSRGIQRRLAFSHATSLRFCSLFCLKMRRKLSLVHAEESCLRVIGAFGYGYQIFDYWMISRRRSRTSLRLHHLAEPPWHAGSQPRTRSTSPGITTQFHTVFLARTKTSVWKGWHSVRGERPTVCGGRTRSSRPILYIPSRRHQRCD